LPAADAPPAHHPAAPFVEIDFLPPPYSWVPIASEGASVMCRLVVGLFCILLLEGCAGLQTGTAPKPETHTITMYPGAWR
jgi:hypothetical protein